MSSYDALLNKIEDFIRKYYVNEIIKGLILFFSIILGTFLIIATLEYVGNFNSAVRTGLFYCFFFVILIVFSIFLIKPLLGLLSIKREMNYDKASQIIGNHFSEVKDKLENLLQLKVYDKKESDLLEASINQKVSELNPIPFKVAVNFKDSYKYLKFLAIPLAVLLISLLVEPNLVFQSTSRLVAHNQEFIPLAPYNIEIKNESLNAYKKEDFRLELEIAGEELPASLNIIIEGDEYVMKKITESSYSYIFNSLEEGVEFNLTDGVYDSKNYTVNVLPKPLLRDFNITLSFPSYINRKNEIVKNTGDINIPEGTQVKWSFETEDTDNLIFLLQDSAYQTIENAKNTYEVRANLYKNSMYSISLNNEFVNYLDTFEYQINVISDEYPKIVVEEVRDSSSSNTLFFNGRLKDDYGFSKLQFVAQKKSSTGEKSKQYIEKINFPLVNESPFVFSINTIKFDLQPGDKMVYYFQVWDNDGINGPKQSVSQSMFYVTSTEKEMKLESSSKSSEIKEEIEENIKLTKEIRKELEELKEKMLDKKELGFQEKKQLEELLKKQKKLKNSVEKINKTNQEKNELDKKLSPESNEILEKQEQLNELFEKVMSEEMKEMMKQLEELMKELNKDKIQEAIERMELSNEDVEKELDRNLELFKQLEVEKELQESIDKLEEIKKKQEKLKKKTEDKKSDKDDLNTKQDSLNKEFEDLKKKLDDLEKKNEELESPNEIKRNESLEKQIQEDMKKSLESLSKNKKQDASDQQEDAEEGMEKMLDEMNQMQMEMESSQRGENLEDLRALLENLIEISFQQEEVMEALRTTKRDDPKYIKLAQKQRDIKDDSKLIEDSLFALSKRVVQIQPIVNRETSKINFNIEKALEALGERNTPVANNRQQLSMTSMNNLALILDEAVQNMQAQMQMKGKGECKKPGKSGKPKPGNMKGMQESLNKQMQSLKESMEKGKGKGKGKKGENGKSQAGGQGQMSKELAQMAAKQAAIRKAVEQMESQLNEESTGNSGNKSGNKLSDLMEKTETDLVNKRITNETILRQQEILTRLLQSEKAEREREKDEQRKSNEAVDNIFRNPNKILEYNRQKEIEIELFRSMPPSLNSFYKSKVTEYFNQINQ